jgi:hypothetical protein
MFFAWLLTQARVHTRDVLLRKNILRASEAGCPLCDESLETASHLFLHCPVARALWATIGVVVPDAAHIGELHLLSMPASVHPVTAPAFMLLCCWHLWKQRNAAVFRAAAPSLQLLLKTCRDDAVLWSGRFPVDLRARVRDWDRTLRLPP